MKALLTALAAIIIAGAAFVGGSLLPHAAPTETVGGAGAIDSVSYHCWAGVCHFYGSKPIAQATSTACAIQSPAATSTIGAFGVRVDLASTTATNWYAGTGSTQYATSSALSSSITAIAASNQAFIQGSSSPSAGSNTVLAPNTWVIFKNNLGITAGDTVAAGFVPTGMCYASFTAPQS